VRVAENVDCVCRPEKSSEGERGDRPDAKHPDSAPEWHWGLRKAYTQSIRKSDKKVMKWRDSH
jgi:hypothetical protein